MLIKKECRDCGYFDKTKVLHYKCHKTKECPAGTWLPKENWDAAKGRGSDHNIEKAHSNLSIVAAHRYDTLDEAIDKLDSNENYVIGECSDCLTSWVAFTKLWGETNEECGCSEDMIKYYNSSD